ncbi:MAG: hypothetical protein FWE67_10670 [Planctomycetaceae bacterium]|nr:hypothetical protein [Planctomycetaceae bacterium]
MKHFTLPGFVFVFCFFCLISSGCRMCGTCYDDCVPSKTARHNDPDSCDPLYRAGSVFYGTADYTDISNAPDCEGCSITNAGYYGSTFSVDKNRPVSAPKLRSKPIDIDSLDIPTLPDLLRGRPTEAPQPQSVPLPKQPEPVKPAVQPKVTKKAVVPPANTAMPQFTVEELRRMENDPSVTDIRILNVEDAIDKAFR